MNRSLYGWGEIVPWTVNRKRSVAHLEVAFIYRELTKPKSGEQMGSAIGILASLKFIAYAT